MTCHDIEAPPGLAAGPILYARGADALEARLGVVAVTRNGAAAPVLHADGSDPVALRLRARLFGHCVWGADFALPAGPDAGYAIDGVRYLVRTDLTGDLAIGFVSCNGQENGDEERSHEDRDVMWRRLAADHRREPLALLLHGGDQLYADEAANAHPETRRWAALPLAEKPGVAWTPDMAEAVRGYFFRRYLALMRQPATAELCARTPSMMIWDDHDIFDGWGSHPPDLQESPVALGLFEAAREMFLLFQLGADPADLPATCRDRSGGNFSQDAAFPGFAVLLPDLRSERRPDRVMGEAGWQAFEAGLAAAPDGDRRIVVSSVPALGPRLSLVEALLDFYPGQQQYEDDLRDQWQSRGHRAEWKRFLSAMEGEMLRHGGPVTVVSGEIHLATRGEMRLPNGSRLHQLVASGITHPKPPAAMAIGLGLLSRLGHSPLKGRPIRLKRLPGQAMIYTADRNYLVLRRRAGEWSGAWELEESGRTPELGI
ncbi:alkaline phosphatase D family protein [Aureimonas sp. ME7]|uniref:alkaline phosphatase D family protein n=1 Tax=Aureimonas sp. ME7 TaxID=2744252 RepID=UPI001FCF129C|nr:alkaline phosphatase D family protein [Aureimonas sp. ME7]